MSARQRKRGDVRTTRRIRRAAAALSVALSLCAAPAFSATLKDVRIGSHPHFTRVVFEFDKPVGYRVERRSDDAETSYVVVTFDAASESWGVASDSAGVSAVSVEAGMGKPSRASACATRTVVSRR